jgi:hypothetical protein
MTAPKYYFYIERMLIDGQLRNGVHLIGDIFKVYEHSHCKINKNTFTHIDLQIPLDSIKDYMCLQSESDYILSFYRGWAAYDFDELISDIEKERIIKLKQKKEEIENVWTKKADAFLVWKRRRQLIAIWTRN